ncbi:MAG: nucleotidyltransferase family protein [Nitriliruptorales bacterium]
MTAAADRVAAVVLAGGEATRFGSTKQLAELRGSPLVAHVVRAALDAGLGEVVVVVGHEGGDVAAAVPPEQHVRVVGNPDHEEGIASSLRAGLRALGPEVACAVVLLADEPGLAPDAVRAVIAGWRESRLPIVRARYGDRPGHPVALDRSVWDRALALRGDAGVREIIRTQPELVHEAMIDARAPVDVDRPEDLDRLH